MKNTILLVLLLFFAVSCKNEAGGGASQNYLEKAVGVSRAGKYIVTNLDNIRQQWQATLDEEGNNDTLDSFAILKGISQGDIQEDYYILVARNIKGNAKTAALLTLKKNKFYFEKQQGAESLVYLKIVCAGDCPTGCDPIVRIAGTDKFLVCSPCIDCVKSEKEMR